MRRRKGWKPEEVLYFGCDMLDFLHDHSRLKFDFDPTGIDTDNSASGYAELKWGSHFKQFTYRKINPGPSYSAGYCFSYAFRDKVVDAFAIVYGGNDKTINGRSKVSVYSTFFAAARLDSSFGLSGLRRFLKDNFHVLPDSLYRCDICLDLSLDLPTVCKRVFDKVSQWHSQIGKDSKHEGFAQTYYTDEIQSSKNRNRLFRVYDKVLDSFKKGKGWLFPHLVGNSEVRRIELELRPDFCKRVCDPSGSDQSVAYVSDVLRLVDDQKLLENVFRSNLADYSTSFANTLVLKPYERYSTDLELAFLELGQLPSSYVKRASGYIRKVREASDHRGIFQLLLGAVSDDRGGVFKDWEVSPFLFLEKFVDFSLRSLGVPAWKMRAVLKKIHDNLSSVPHA